MVNVILRYKNTNVNAKTCFGHTSLYEACNPPSIEMITMLLTHKADVNLRDGNKITPLMKASSYGNVQAINLLIEAGSNVNAQDTFDRTAIIFAIRRENNPDALNTLLTHNAKLCIPGCPQYNPLLFATYKSPELVDILIPFCKYEKNFSDALMGAILTNRIDIFEKLMENGAKLTKVDTDYLLNLVIRKGLNNVFDLLWQNINKKFYLNTETFTRLFNLVFHIDEVSFFERSLKTIINTPDFNCNFSNEPLVITRILEPTPGPIYNWNLCKNTLLEFCEYINRQGIKISNYELSIFIEYFNNHCQFVSELLTVFFKNNPELIVTFDDLTYFSSNDLNLTSLLLYKCSDLKFLQMFQNRTSIYEYLKLHTFSEKMLTFFLQRFTPTKSDIEDIRHFAKFDINIMNIESLEVPTLKELSRNSLRKNYKLKAMLQNLYIPSAIKDIVYFKTTVNDI